MKGTNSQTGWVLAALLLCGLVGGASGQETEAPQSIFSEVLDVRVVNVEIVVTDRDGVRVSGLEAEDFELLVDGEPTTIDYFSEIRGGRVMQLAEGTADVELPGSLEPGQEVGTSYLVFIDDQFSIARDRNRVLDRMEEDLARLGENDRMAIVSFDGRELSMLNSWTRSPRVLERSFREARAKRTFGLQRMAELNTNDRERRDRSLLATTTDAFLMRAGQEPRESVTRHLNPIEWHYANRLEEQLSRSVSAAVASLRSFASPPGRKVMLILASNWPLSPAAYTVASYDGSFEDIGWASLDNAISGGGALYGSLTDTANLLGYTVYPVDVPGIARMMVGAEVAAPDAFSGAGELRNGGMFVRERITHDGLHYIATATGGEALINSDRDVAFARVVADTRSYYWLGFSPDRKEDDLGHDIEVKVRRNGYTVRSRNGFHDFSRQTESTMMVESSLFFGNPPSSVPLDLSFGKPRRAGRGKVIIALDVGIPMDSVTLIPVQGKLRASLEIRVTVMDEDGARSDTPMATIRIEGETAPSPGQMFHYETTLTLRRRKHRVIVAVNDPVSGIMMSSSTELSP